MNFTPEQMDAINKSGTNIIVSAGAGSGKTAVLSERVLHKIEEGIHINELLILTFTSAAASEMKDRIRKKLSSDPKYEDELNRLSSSFISTFDSYALLVLKKYSYLLNVSPDISITDESIVLLKSKEILDQIFEEYYAKNNETFNNLILNYSVKNDRSLRENVLKLCNQVNNKINKEGFISNIRNNFFSDENINNIIEKFKNLIVEKKNEIINELDTLNYYFEGDVVSKFNESINPIISSSTDELCLFTKVNLPRINKYPSEESKKEKEVFKSLCDELVNLGKYGTREQIKESILSNKDYVLLILNIIEEFIKRLNEYKRENNIYTFFDVSYLSIKILKDHKEVREEIRDSFKEIMIDEYQDTNDVQDLFISLIENNNVYMVGDIKQSIYRFRGSNPTIFKDKYDKYSLNNGGIKIDLKENFRSRNEVLINVNKIFELLMDDFIGGCNFSLSHKMIFGNKTYNEEKMEDFKYDIDILEYDNSTKEYSNSEIEIFSIVSDIKEKIKNKIKVFDKKSNKLRLAKYSDFVIILDRSNYFDTFKKIFEYEGVPLTVMRDESLNSSDELLLIKNMIDFVIRINHEDYDVSFKYDFISIARSFLYEYSDQEIFDIFKNDTFKETSIYKDFSVINNIDSISPSDLFESVLDITKYYDKIYKIGDYKNINIKLNNLYNISCNLNNMGYSIDDFVNYIDNIIENGIDIKYSTSSDREDSVKIMTIHASKGLEYPICYFADLDHKFNISDINDNFLISDNYGLLLKSDTDVLKELYKKDYLIDEISERIRLFYVALTRAREKIIVLLPYKNTIKLPKDQNGVIEETKRRRFNKLSDLLYSTKDYLGEYFSQIDINKLPLTKKYLFKKNDTKKLDVSDEVIDVKEISITNEEVEEKHFSKENNSIISYEDYKNMKYGTSVHEILELIDFNNYDENDIDDKFIRGKVNSLLKNDLFKNVSTAKIYKEYEFMHEDKELYHGMIDLMLEYDDYIDIVDYKLRSVSDKKYLEQLNGYKKYIEKLTNKVVNIYLYSIIDEKMVKLI